MPFCFSLLYEPNFAIEEGREGTLLDENAFGGDEDESEGEEVPWETVKMHSGR